MWVLLTAPFLAGCASSRELLPSSTPRFPPYHRVLCFAGHGTASFISGYKVHGSASAKGTP